MAPGVTDEAPILLDVTRLIWRRWRGRLPTGIDRVCLAYLEHFAPRAQAVVQHDRFRRILDRSASEELFDLLESPRGDFKRRLFSTALRNAARFSDRGQGRPYLNVGHTGLDSHGFRRWISRADVKPIYLVHDLIPITHPQFCRAGESERHRERMRTVLATAAGVIGNSQGTLDELAQFARAEALPWPPTLAAWLGVGRLPYAERTEMAEPPTFVSLGTIEARKNHILLLSIWSRLVDRFGKDAPRLLIIGQRGWEADEVFARLDTNEILRGHVVELSRCTDRDLGKHLASARALLFPTFAEGYGLPLVEALGSGIPVIASDLPVFREIGGDIPCYLNAADENGWERAILDYGKPHSAERVRQLQRMEGFRPPEWADHFARVESWLETLF